LQYRYRTLQFIVFLTFKQLKQDIESCCNPNFW